MENLIFSLNANDSYLLMMVLGVFFQENRAFEGKYDQWSEPVCV